MTARPPHRPSAACALMVSCIALLAPTFGLAKTTSVYKCLDARLGVTYTDEPCKDGELITIRAGDADPAAVARLERVSDAMDQRALQQIADQRRAVDQRDFDVRYAGAGEPYGLDVGAPYDYGVAGWVPAYGARHPTRARPRKFVETKHFAPKPSPMVPRR